MNSRSQNIVVPDILASQHAQMAEMAMLKGEKAKAHRAIDRAFELARNSPPKTVTLDSPVSAVVNERMCGALEKKRVRTVGDLVTCTREFLMCINNVGMRSVEMVENNLAKHGFSLEVRGGEGSKQNAKPDMAIETKGSSDAHRDRTDRTWRDD